MNKINRLLRKHRRHNAGPLDSTSVNPRPSSSPSFSFGEGSSEIQIVQSYGNITSHFHSSGNIQAATVFLKH
jgi:hypothetical protein